MGSIDRPDYYSHGRRETIEIIRDVLTEKEFAGFCVGNALKYISRYKHKGDGYADLSKAISYLMYLRASLSSKDEAGEDQKRS